MMTDAATRTPAFPPATRTPLTEARYRVVADCLERRLRERLMAVREDFDDLVSEPATSIDVTPSMLADIFLRTEHEYARATARLYRAALIFVWERRGDPNSLAGIERLHLAHLDDEAIFERREEVRLLRHERRQATGPRTAERKTKKLAPDDWRALLAALAASRSRWKHETITWLEAGALTGLRPAEWYGAELIEVAGKVPALRVVNAKATNGRAHGPSRTLLLDACDAEDLACIREQVRIAASYHGLGAVSRHLHYDNCRILLYEVARRLWPRRTRRPSLYTARHLFASAAKTRFSQAGVAALMGQAAIETATIHYGRRRHAHGPAKVTPIAGDVDAVLALDPTAVPEPPASPIQCQATSSLAR